MGVQLFGADAHIMGEAAAQVLARIPFDLVDINMGCPVRKVCKRGAGAALMRDMGLAARIIRAVVRAARPTPVSVKFRARTRCRRNRTQLEFGRYGRRGQGAKLTQLCMAAPWPQGIFRETRIGRSFAAVKGCS